MQEIGSILGLERSPREGNDNPLQYSCLGNPMNREAWWAIVHGINKKIEHDLVTKQQQFLIQRDLTLKFLI